MVAPKKTTWSLVAVGLAIGLAAAACGSSGGTGGAGGTGGGGNNGGGGALDAGIVSNLDSLTSYQFSWHITATASSPTKQGAGAYGATGTVVNTPQKAYRIDNGQILVIAIGDQGWISHDNGATWTTQTTYTVNSSALKSLLPFNQYALWFDAYASEFNRVGSENKNGIDCWHYSGGESLAAMGAALGYSGTFKADLWVAKDGNYPVSGRFGWTGSGGSQSGSFEYAFDITHVNDPANVITAPTNVK